MDEELVLEAAHHAVGVAEVVDRRAARAEARVEHVDERVAQLVEETGMLSFPQIVVGDVVVGGFQQLVQADQSGRLAELTAQAA